MDRIPSTLFRLLIPLILGFVLGFILGNYSIKFNTRKGERVVRILSLLGFAIPIILITLSFQFFPINNIVFLWITLTISHMALTIILVRIYLKNLSKGAPEKRSNIIFALLVGFSYGIMFAFFVQTEIMFGIGGVGELLLQAFSTIDYYIINAIIFIILFSVPIFILLSLFLFFLFGKVRNWLTNK
jgi:ABC-type dipeptide/oligopeptide/nickel transport system permease component